MTMTTIRMIAIKAASSSYLRDLSNLALSLALFLLYSSKQSIFDLEILWGPGRRKRERYTKSSLCLVKSKTRTIFGHWWEKFWKASLRGRQETRADGRTNEQTDDVENDNNDDEADGRINWKINIFSSSRWTRLEWSCKLKSSWRKLLVCLLRSFVQASKQELIVTIESQRQSELGWINQANSITEWLD